MSTVRLENILYGALSDLDCHLAVGDFRSRLSRCSSQDSTSLTASTVIRQSYVPWVGSYAGHSSLSKDGRSPIQLFSCGKSKKFQKV